MRIQRCPDCKTKDKPRCVEAYNMCSELAEIRAKAKVVIMHIDKLTKELEK